MAVILPATDLAAAIVVAERIRSSIESLKVMNAGKELSVTVSVGVSQYDSVRDSETRDIIERADKALYKAKQEGRNRVCFLE